ncbi:hypothetical protein LOAG_04998 [Loa loa]|uniref:Uncharacterized protein n=1 Tax=Loa loa TaxID=7209 RepID=A0A1S0U1E9_LOALO|nr:hypothetical protein LOAG_04998 [Loa loa]EFO23484.1 hypothetical protein LOAG_04998 [Loa loa]
MHRIILVLIVCNVRYQRHQSMQSLTQQDDILLHFLVCDCNLWILSCDEAHLCCCVAQDTSKNTEISQFNCFLREHMRNQLQGKRKHRKKRVSPVPSIKTFAVSFATRLAYPALAFLAIRNIRSKCA